MYIVLRAVHAFLSLSFWAASVNSKAVFVLTEEGGHLGFYEGGLLIPNTITWMDRLVVQYIDTVHSIDKKF